MSNIVHYNGSMLGLLMYHWNIKDSDAYNLQHLSKVFGEITLIDRTDTLKNPIKTKITYPMPKEWVTVPDINTIGLYRAKDILEKAKSLNKKIVLMWSGGLDSTAALMWFLATGLPLDNFEVALNQYSIDEYPACYEFLKRTKLTIVESNRYVLDIPNDTLLVTGEHGDQLFGSTVMKRFNNCKVKPYGYHEYQYEHNIHALNTPMYPLFSMLFVEASCDINGESRIREYLQPLIDKAPFKLKTLFDLTWWLNFTLKWQEVGYRMTTSCPDKHNSHIGFFSSEDFQLWAMDEKNHIENKINWNDSDPWNTSYKKALRDIIFRLTGDIYYRNTKPKVDSLMHHNLNGMCFRYDTGEIETLKDVIVGLDKTPANYFNLPCNNI